MINISKSEFDINCPECNFLNKITLQQVADEETIKCISCQKNIKLVDNDNHAKEAILSINKSLNDFGNSINTMNIKLKL